jgi:hypothetical protein
VSAPAPTPEVFTPQWPPLWVFLVIAGFVLLVLAGIIAAVREQARYERRRREVEPTCTGPWYPIVNDLIGGTCVSDVDAPLSQHQGYVIAECMTMEDAERIARLLNAEEATP